MNKRQIKKRNKIVCERIKFFLHLVKHEGRRNGKTQFIKTINKACFSKSYKTFKDFKKYYEKLFIAIDWSNGKDYSIETSYKIKNGIVTIIKSEIVS